MAGDFEFEGDAKAFEADCNGLRGDLRLSAADAPGLRNQPKGILSGARLTRDSRSAC
jgi:hypothetical protein